MRMSDQPSVSVQTVIGADPDDIYEVVSDLDAMGSFGTEFEGGTWVSGAPRAAGSRFTGRQRMGERTWESTSVVTSAVAGRSFAWNVVNTDGDVSSTWTLTLRTVPDGTEVTYDVVVGPGRSGLTRMIEERPDAEARLIERRLATFQENMVKVLEGVRRRVGG